MKSLRFGLIGLLAVAFAVAAGNLRDAMACDCALPPPPKQALANSTAVLQAKVVKIDDDPALPGSRKVTLQVERWWKGGAAATLTVSTAKSGAACGYGFQVGVRYLVYAHTEDKQLWVSLCSRTRLLTEAEKTGDLKEIGAGKAPTAK